VRPLPYTEISPLCWPSIPLGLGRRRGVLRQDELHRAARTSRTLGSLGFASDETITDFYAMGENPDPVPDESSRDPDFDPSLGTEDEQRAYYELLMGRKFLSDRSTKH
jgi:hypothetical protein